MSHVELEGLDALLEPLLEEVEELAYLTLTDRTDPGTEQRLARLDLTPHELAPWLDDDLVQHGAPEFVSPAQLEPDVLERALWRWASHVARSHASPGAEHRLRLRAYAVKGHRVLGGGTFFVRPVRALPAASVDEDVAVAAPEPLPLETFEELEIEGARAGMRALGTYYAQWGGIVLSSMRQVQSVQNDMIDRLQDQVKDSRSQVDELLAALIETRASASLAQVREDAEIRRQQTNTMLAQQAIHGIGEAAKAFALAKSGLDPKLAGVADKLAQSPELLDTLQSEDVQALMADPDNLKTVAQMLQQAAQAAKAMNAAKAAAAAKNADKEVSA